MHRRWLLLAVNTLTAVTLFTLPVESQLDTAHIDKLIKQLGSSKFADRENASRELEAIGAAALPQLRAALKVDNPEAKSRTSSLVKKLEDTLSAEALLAPKMVNLSLKDVTVPDAVAELKRQSGYEIEVQGDRMPLEKRRISLETGKVPFWIAFDKLREAAELIEILPFTDVVIKSNTAKSFGARVRSREHWFDPIIVRDGKPKKVPTCYFGSLRIRVNASNGVRGFGVKEGETLLVLEVTGEPNLRWFSVVDTPQILKAFDDQGREMKGIGEHPEIARMADLGVCFGRDVPVYLSNAPTKPAAIREVAGTLLVQAAPSIPEAFLTVDDVAKAAGKKTAGAKGGFIEVVSFEKIVADGTYRVRIRFETPPSHLPENGPWGGIPDDFEESVRKLESTVLELAMMRAEARFGQVSSFPLLNFNEGLPVLIDANERVYILDTVSEPIFDKPLAVNSGQLVQDRTMVFRSRDGSGPPAKLVLYGYRTRQVSVTFRFGHIPLP